MKYLITILLILPLFCSAQYLDLLDDNECKVQATIYYDNGKIKELGCYNESQTCKVGNWTSYNQDGILLSSVSFNSEGRRNGIWAIYDDEGILRAQMEYKNGERVGVWKVFDNKGILVNKRNY